MKTKLFLSILLVINISVSAQTDNEFWFAAPDVTGGHSCGANPTPGHGRPVFINLTAEQATTVKIEMPGNPTFIPVEFSLAAGENRRQAITPTYLPDVFENYPMSYPPAVGQTIQKKAFHITSDPGNITVYYELNNDCNRDIFALKGKNALGTDFYVSTQNYWSNGNYTPLPYSGFVIVATEDNTTIDITRNGAWQFFTGAPAVETIVLNKGETFAFVANSQAAAQHIMGVKVHSSKKIAITWYDDSIAKGGCRDITGDQLIPVNLIGKNYIVMKGDVAAANGGERFFITATVNNTQVFVDGILKTTINAGQFYNEQVVNPTVRIFTSEPAYVNHITGTGGGCELGGATLPTIDGCTGSNSVTFTRGTITTDPLRLNLMVRNETNAASPYKNKSVENFTLVVGNNSYPIPKAYFTFLPDSTWAFLNWTPAVNTFFTSVGRITPGTTATIRNPIARFHLGVQNGGASNGGKYGYFSDYASNRGRAGIGGPNAPAKKTYCSLDPIMFAVEGGYAYKWFSLVPNPGDTVYLNSTTNNEVYLTPPVAGLYKFGVTIYRECYTDTIIYVQARVINAPVADFILDNPVGCSPYVPLFTNTTNFTLADKMLWNFNAIDFSDTISQSALPNPFHHNFPENNTDTLQYYHVRLTAWGPFGECPSYREKILTIKPGAIADFNLAGDSVGCTPLSVNFINNSSGYIDSSGYYWDFGDNTQSFEIVPSHTYINYSRNDTVYHSKLIVSTPFGCTDTSIQDIVVHPYIKASLALDTAFTCSPMVINMNVNNSIGVDTFKWHIDYSDHISNFNRLNYSPVLITHTDTSLSSPDTVKIDLVVKNRMGCADMVPTHKIVVFPVVNADFAIDKSEVCDSVKVNFTNTSSGFDLKFYLNFGDGVSAVDSIKKTIPHAYFNRTNSDVTYTATLTTTSAELCIDNKDTVITVHPYIDANFAVDFESSCAPIDITISNLSTRVNIFDWNFGDGSAHSNSSASLISHQYWNPLPDRDTTYILKLLATNNEGCKDSAQQTILIFPQVVAAFDISPGIGCNPLTIDFDNYSTGKNLFYNWKFGNELSSSEGSSAFQRTFSHYSKNDSAFNITLTVMNNFGCDSVISKPVTIYSYIDADFVAARSDSCSPFNVRINNTSPAGVTSYRWNFGDGTPESILFEPPHTYNNTTLSSLNRQLRLVVKNNHLCYDTLIRNITVYPEIRADFTVNDLDGCQPFNINVTNNYLFPNIDYNWNFDDGTSSASKLPVLTHLYTNNQPNLLQRNLSLYAISQYGCSDDTVQTITIYPFIYAKFATTKASVCSDEPFSIDRSASQGGIDELKWDFNNDGTDDLVTPASAAPVFSHSYSNTSTSNYDPAIKLTVTNLQGCDTSWIQNLTVFPEVNALFNMDDHEPCYPHQSMIQNVCPFKGVVETNFFWEFGDGDVSIEDGDLIFHRYNNFDYDEDKEYIIKLIAESDFECRDTITDTITIHPKPKADFNFPVTVDCPPFTVPFTNSSGGVNLNYQWNFDDGTGIIVADNPDHLFFNDGYEIVERMIQLTATSEFGCEDTANRPINVYPQVHVDFLASSWEGCSPLTVNFDGSAINQNDVIWYLNESAFSTLDNSTYRFVNNTQENMVHNIKFKATSIYNCTDDTTKQVIIYPSPLAEFIPDPILQEFNTLTDITDVTIDNYTLNQNSGAWEYYWDYGDGRFDSNPAGTFVKEYDHWGDINNGSRIPITLIVRNINNPECRDTVKHEIIIRPPLPQIDIAEDVAGCAPLTVDFASTTKYIYEDSYQWSFGYNDETGAGSTPEFTYPVPGMYIVKLVVEGDGGLNWDYKKITVHPKPEIDFSFSPKNVLLASDIEPADTVRFYNNTRQGFEYTWDFGDESFPSNEKEPYHVYEKIDSFYITLNSISTEGCESTYKNPIPVVVEGVRQLEFPNAFIVDPTGPANEYYNPNDPNPKVFRPLARGVLKYRLEIYNRWGELIFVSEDVNRGWNGYIKGQLMKQDVYVWRASATFTDGKPIIKAGDVTLLLNSNQVE